MVMVGYDVGRGGGGKLKNPTALRLHKSTDTALIHRGNHDLSTPRPSKKYKASGNVFFREKRYYSHGSTRRGNDQIIHAKKIQRLLLCKRTHNPSTWYDTR